MTLKTINNLFAAVALSRLRSKEPGALSFSRQLIQMAALMIRRGFGPGNYHKYRLWQSSIPWSEKLNYWHDQKYYAFLDRVNPIKYRIVARNKILAKALLRFYSIPDAEYIGYISRHGGLSASGEKIDTANDLEALIEARPDLERFCLKPVEGSGGDGFRAFRIIRQRGIHLAPIDQDDVVTVDDAMKSALSITKFGDYIMERYIEQHPLLSQFNPSSLNTLRVWVGKSDSEPSKLIGLYLRVGREGSLVDNRLSGGFGVAVDLKTFKTIHAVPQDSSGQCFVRHPDSGFDMSNRQLPFKDEVLLLSLNVLNVLPSTNFVGLDVALTTEGPVLVEFNFAPTAIGACVIGKSHRELLGWIESEQSP